MAEIPNIIMKMTSSSPMRWMTNTSREKKSKHVLYAGIVLSYGGMLTATHLTNSIIKPNEHTDPS